MAHIGNNNQNKKERNIKKTNNNKREVKCKKENFMFKSKEKKYRLNPE